jgi:hypothetical protein
MEMIKEEMIMIIIIIITTNNRTIKRLVNYAAAAIINKSLREEAKIKEDVSIDLSNQLLVISKSLSEK